MTSFNAPKVTKTAKELIYSVSNAIRILGRKYHALKVEVWFNCVYVWAKGQVSRFVSKKAFTQKFVDFRKAGSVGLEVVKVPFETGEYMIKSASKDGSYLVQCLTDKLTCTCQDYQAQAAAMNKACCKHCYATLSYLGFDSLAAYIA
ncbi:SWIM zinc finger family protein [Candidatus Synechococcus calcipolaris G9]|uniref:SWIM zinc finger family protein n=1 Tax=Candidatus Synechococcus calcipolaris G9 TaxID=1497997 RepID=A0ABT6EY54_9SYNE|nr:SWIM zinc finger family protein [Candidatus Synechococcus calcipolaris]MDG2990734.1 SWIM zinc finger family protein [Candidatus Synechococcus calcipolaris G9]